MRGPIQYTPVRNRRVLAKHTHSACEVSVLALGLCQDLRGDTVRLPMRYVTVAVIHLAFKRSVQNLETDSIEPKGKRKRGYARVGFNTTHA